MAPELTVDVLKSAISEGIAEAQKAATMELFAKFNEQREEILRTEGDTDAKLKQLSDDFTSRLQAVQDENTELKRTIAEREFQPAMDQDRFRQIRMPIGESELTRTPCSDAEKAGQVFADQLYLLGMGLQGVNAWSKQQMADALLETKFMKNALKHWPELQKTIDTVSAGTGLEWVPQGFSTQMNEAVFIASRVPQLFPVLPMPTPTYTAPVALARPKAYKATQGSDRTMDTTNLTANRVFTAQPIAVYVPVTQEATEDLLVPILSWLSGEMAAGLADGVEACILNGDLTATHMDTDIEAAGPGAVETCWDGLRHRGLAVAGCKIDISTFTADQLVLMKSALGKYGLNPDDLVWLFGPTLLNSLLLLRDSKDNLLMTTVDKYGASATILTGEVGRLFGIPVVPSASVREDTNANGVNGASGNTYKTNILVNRRSWFVGDRKRTVLESDKNIVNQTYRLVANARMDFQHIYGANETTTAVGYKG